MQSYDERDRLVQAKILEAEKMLGLGKAKEMQEQIEQRLAQVGGQSMPSVEQIRAAMLSAQSKGAVKHVIANMPNNGQEVEINGLKFKVSYVNNRRGDVHLKLQGIEDDADRQEA